MKLRKLLALSLVLCMLLAYIPAPARAATTFASGTCGDNLTWVLDSNGTLTISGTGDMEDYTGSMFIFGIETDGIRERPWEDYTDRIISVVIENGVTSIGGGAFFKCARLTSVSMPSSITHIDWGAFYKCTSLTSAALPQNLTIIKSEAFSGCTSLTSVAIPDSVKTISLSAFAVCTSLTNVTIGKGVTNIVDNAFYGCTSLTDIYFLGNAPEYMHDVFEDTTATAWYPSGNSTWTSSVRQDCGGNITWKSYNPSTLKILIQPSSQNVPVSSCATFLAVASGSGLSYQWQYRTSSSGSWKNATATGNQTATLSVPGTTGRSGYQYRCKITDNAGNVVYTNAASLYVLGIKTQPTSQTVSAGSNATFTVTATGHNKTYQWQYRTSSTGTWKNATATGNKTATLTVPGTASRNGYQYRCKITDSAGNVVYSNAATLSVKTVESLAITKQPTMQKVKDGKVADFSVSATGIGLSYQWQYRASSSGTWANTTLAGNKTATLSVTATTGRSGYQYRCKITDSAGNVVYTNAASLYVLGIKTQPTSQTVSAGSTATFAVTATGHNKTYQWQYRTSSTGTWKNATATGNQTATLTVPGTASRNGYQYRCKITDSAGNVVYTDAVTLTVK